jgi:hypothetical protein
MFFERGKFGLDAVEFNEVQRIVNIIFDQQG